MVSASSKESVKDENALYIFNRLLRMAAETELSTWKQNQVRNFMKHDQIDEILSLTDGFGRTILDSACSAGNLRLVQLLWPMGAKLGKPHVTMAIVCADTEHNVAILDYLLAHDPKLASTEIVTGEDDENESERLPLLHFCAKKGDERVLSILMAYAFKTPESVITSVDALGNTPLHVVRKEKIAAQLLNRSGLDILSVANRRGQLPIDSLLERYRSMPAGYEEDLKKTIAFLNTLMNHSKPTPRTPSSPTVLPRLSASELTASSLLSRRNSGNVNVGPSRTAPMLPPRDVPKSFLSRDLISSAVARNRVMLLQERQHREIIKNEVLKSDVLARQQMLMDDLRETSAIEEHHKQTLLAMERTNPLAIMEAATRVAKQQQQQLSSSSTTPPALRLPLSPRTGALSPGNNHDRYVAAIDAAFASEVGSGTSSHPARPSLSLLASAFAKGGAGAHLPHTFENPLHAKGAAGLLGGGSGLTSLEEHRLLLAKSMYPPRFEDNELHKMLRAKYG